MDDMTYAVADAMAHNVKKAQEQAWAWAWHNRAKQLAGRGKTGRCGALTFAEA